MGKYLGLLWIIILIFCNILDLSQNSLMIQNRIQRKDVGFGYVQFDAFCINVDLKFYCTENRVKIKSFSIVLSI